MTLSSTLPKSQRFWLVPIVWMAAAAACQSGEQRVTLTAQDYRFDPALVQVHADRPLVLTVYNAGREVHEFASPLLAYAREAATDDRAQRNPLPGVVTLEPGRSVRLIVNAPAGTYLYWCKRKGHPNMSGTLLME